MPLPTERRQGTLVERCDKLDALLAQVESDGVHISDASRFRFYSKLLRAFASSGEGVLDLSEDDVLRVGTASTESGELVEALDLLLRPPRIDGWLPLLPKVRTFCALGDLKLTSRFRICAASCTLYFPAFSSGPC